MWSGEAALESIGLQWLQPGIDVRACYAVGDKTAGNRAERDTKLAVTDCQNESLLCRMRSDDGQAVRR